MFFTTFIEIQKQKNRCKISPYPNYDIGFLLSLGFLQVVKETIASVPHEKIMLSWLYVSLKVFHQNLWMKALGHVISFYSGFWKLGFQPAANKSYT